MSKGNDCPFCGYRGPGFHPLEYIVFHMARENEIIDVTTVAYRLSGAFLRGRDSAKGRKAYRMVAADLLGYMTTAGRLEMHGDFGKHPEEGGPYFLLINRQPA